jgi:hypothetical protein
VDGGTGGDRYMLDAGEPAARLQNTACDRDTGRGFET